MTEIYCCGCDDDDGEAMQMYLYKENSEYVWYCCRGCSHKVKIKKGRIENLGKCYFCGKEIKTKSSLVTLYHENDENEFTEFNGYAHYGCAVRDGCEEIHPAHSRSHLPHPEGLKPDGGASDTTKKQFAEGDGVDQYGRW